MLYALLKAADLGTGGTTNKLHQVSLVGEKPLPEGKEQECEISC